MLDRAEVTGEAKINSRRHKVIVGMLDYIYCGSLQNRNNRAKATYCEV